jgi:hypothetical protein
VAGSGDVIGRREITQGVKVTLQGTASVMDKKDQGMVYQKILFKYSTKTYFV